MAASGCKSRAEELPQRPWPSEKKPADLGLMWNDERGHQQTRSWGEPLPPETCPEACCLPGNPTDGCAECQREAGKGAWTAAELTDRTQGYVGDKS